MSRLQATIEDLRIKADVEFTPELQPPDPKWECNRWKVTLRKGKRRLTVPFFTGMAHPEPTAADVLSCLVSDIESINGSSFEEWANEFGYDQDSRKAERIYQECVKLAPRVQRFLGEHLAEITEAARDY